MGDFLINMPFAEQNSNGVVYMTAPNIQATHAFTTRFGGVSQGIYSSLNLGINCGDDPARVRENYRLTCSALNIAEYDIVCSNQIHGTHIRVVSRGDCGGLFRIRPQEADGLITQSTGVALMVFTADCVPILLHDHVRHVIGAIHAGWRGTALNIAGAAIQRMVDEFSCFPADISAAIGPPISKCCYETGQDVADALRNTLGNKAETCIALHGNKYMVDLKESNRLLLERAGLRDIMISDDCTSCQSDKYWSHRKTNGKRGSQIAIIAIVE